MIATPSGQMQFIRRSDGTKLGAPSAEWQAIADTTRRGYTGHEQIDNVMVVHMNGLALDPVIGRFEPANDSTYQFGTKPT